MNLSSALEYSSQPPVSVYGTGCNTRFSRKVIRGIITAAVALVYYLRLSADSTCISVSTHPLLISVTFVVLQVTEY